MIGVRHLVFVSLEGFQVFDLVADTHTKKKGLQHLKGEPSAHSRNPNASGKRLCSANTWPLFVVLLSALAICYHGGGDSRAARRRCLKAGADSELRIDLVYTFFWSAREEIHTGPGRSRNPPNTKSASWNVIEPLRHLAEAALCTKAALTAETSG